MSRWAPAYLERVNRSFAAVYALLERPRVARNAVVALLAMQSGLLAYSAYVHSPTLNEPGHLVAGLSYWKFGRFDVYNVNPPLVKLVAALPVMAVGYEEDWSGFYPGLGARPEMGMGKDFVAANGERSFFLFMIARWACIPFSWLGGIVCYLWARDLYGRPAGVIACTIWCFEPTILAHASLITPDAHAASLGLTACYTFWRWLKHPTWTQTLVTGVVLGLAELAKTTFILFYPLWPLLWIAYRWRHRQRMPLATWLQEAGMLVTRMAIGLYVLNLGYSFDGSFTPLSEISFVSDLFTDHSQLTLGGHHGATSQIPKVRNRFAGGWLGSVPVPLPKCYLTGIDLQQSDFEHYGHPSYLHGEWRDYGWWYYYLYAIAIKLPLGIWMLGVLAIATRSSRRTVANAYTFASTMHRDTIVLMLPPLVVFIIVSMKTGFSEHMRYILPCLPFGFIAAASALRYIPCKNNMELVDSVSVTGWFATRINAPCRVLLLLWATTSSLWIYPHTLSYFNETVGGPVDGSKYLLGSNVDWGQDFRYFQDFARVSKEPLDLLYFGGFDASVFGFSVESELSHCTSTRDNAFKSRDPCHMLVISVNILKGSSWLTVGEPQRIVRVLHEQMLEHEDIGGSSDILSIGYSIKAIRNGCATSK